MDKFDTVLVGGGLQNALVALGLAEHQPGLRVAMVERGERVGGNHLWCFHAGDLTPTMQSVVEPVVVHRFEHYDVHFPNLHRRLDEAYAAVSSERLGTHVEGLFNKLGWSLRLGVEVTDVSATRVTLSDDSCLDATLVVDSRGPSALGSAQVSGWQKFVGLELELDRDAPIQSPILMDARVPQSDGFRFMYVLPFSPRRVLIEDTYFSTSPDLDAGHVRNEVLAYALSQRLSVSAITRQEQGVLPLPLRAPPPRASAAPLRAGYAGGWFHPTTGYSFPVAARLAEHIATRTPDRVHDERFHELVTQQARQLRFSTFLNRLLFNGFAPQDRWHVLERFYRLSVPTIRRFYAHQTTAFDRARVLCGRPPQGIRISSFMTGGATQ